MNGKAQLISIEEGIGKMRAALAARRDPGLVIAGRTSAASITSVADAIERARAYEAAGVDAVFRVGGEDPGRSRRDRRSDQVPFDSRRRREGTAGSRLSGRA